MKASLTRFRAAVPAAITGVALAMVGCADTTTHDDVADARAALEEEREETEELIREGEEEIAEAEREAFEATKPVVEEGREDVAAVERDVAESIRQQRKEEMEAADKLRTAEQELHARQARDAYVKRVEHDLAEIELDIDQLQERAADAEGDEKADLDQQIAILQLQHERAEEALEELRDADLDEWETHQQNVRIAMEDLDAGLNNIR